ncbi:MAG TPA: lipid A export permease/ATP-binding protein MsbA [Rugosibacter sp.]|nr:lipid A export permease/ATP-binding protein MsbA [Rugosibacter sp.]HPB90044.1 lipid A export permease/ATP-binding protein MsbA [Rugosibacter sp.]HQN45776.1 lipid A export permease/ATP-binding protein MsbA [Rugosibacter sp.]HQQ35648.1 lipid A export permease/ATP-binding protein MsbA [Rugosibacter sp.]
MASKAKKDLPNPSTSRALYFRLLGYVKPYWRFFLLAIVFMAISASTEPLLPALMKPLLDSGFSGHATGIYNSWLLPFLIVGVFLIRGMFGFFADYALSWVSNKVVLDLRQDMFQRLIQLPTTYFDNQSSGAVMSRIAYDVTGVTSAATGVLTVLIKDSFAVIGLLTWMFYLNWQLSLIALVMVPGIALAVMSFSKRLRSTSRGVQEAMGEIMHVLEESIEAHKVVKIFGGQDYERKRFANASGMQRRQAMRQTVAAAALGPIVQTFAAIALAIIITVAIQQSNAGDKTTVGSFVSFITAMLMLLAPLKRLTDINAPLQRGLAAAESVFSMVDAVPEDDFGTTTLGRVEGNVVFRKVHLRYPDAARDALTDINLSLPKGKTVALVGTSGSGKTSLANLLPRFYHPTSGEILIDGHPIENLTLSSLRSNIALVSQDVVLFNDTVAANIAYGLDNVTEEKLLAATRAAHALEFIQGMPEGFATMIGENGVKLSGGQRQRLAIARALLKDAPILILDEATSALDTESERHVQAALDSLMRNRTTLVVAHRLSTIEHADHIVVLEAGKIIEEGNHATLLACNGAYANFYQMQRATEKKNTPN